VRSFNEVCDDFCLVNGDGCDANCTPTGCGNGVQTAGEQCDLGAQNSDAANSSCRTDCTQRRCGDGVVDGAFGEQCESGAECNVAQCIFGTQVCVTAGCYLDIGTLAHGFTEQAPPNNGATAQHPYFRDVVFDCTENVDVNTLMGGFATICETAVPMQVSEDVVVFTMRSLHVTSTGDVRFRDAGTFGDRDVVFAVYGDVVVDAGGHFDVNANLLNSGAGERDCSGEAGALDDGGGGGGGHGTAGGRGGDAGGELGGAGGAPSLGNVHATLLRGCRGGDGGNGAGGGGSGGVLQISSGGTVVINGIVASNGGAGGVGLGGGGGGGSGGDLYVQAVRLVVGGTGALLAQGGSGAAGEGGVRGNNGTNNPATRATGGPGTGTSDGAGDGGAGAGGAGDGTLNPAAAGQSLTSEDVAGAGGGGGGVGRIGVDVVVCNNLATTRFSPQPQCQ
jgi:hypothetical protein